jgi:hypothetical protein
VTSVRFTIATATIVAYFFTAAVNSRVMSASGISLRPSF